MLYCLHRSLRRAVALCFGVVALIVAVIAAAVLNAAPALAHVPPPEPAEPAAVKDVPISASTNGAPVWTYLLVACAALLIGAVTTYVLTRSQTNRRLVALQANPTVAA